MDNKYIIYVGTGGLCHMLSGLSIAIDKAIINKRILIIDCLRLSCFKNKVLNYFDINVQNLKIEENYNSIINDNYNHLSIQEFKIIHPKIISGQGYYIDKYNVSSFQGNEDNNKIIAYAGYGGKNINKFITIKGNIISDIKNKFANIINEKYVSIHFRNTDMKHDINFFINLINNNKEKLKKDSIQKIFIATDDYNAFNIFKEKLSDFAIFKVNQIENLEGKCIHYFTKDKDKVILDLLNDIYIILNSQYFIPSKKSGVSQWIIQMINENFNIFKIENINCKLL